MSAQAEAQECVSARKRVLVHGRTQAPAGCARKSAILRARVLWANDERDGSRVGAIVRVSAQKYARGRTQTGERRGRPCARTDLRVCTPSVRTWMSVCADGRMSARGGDSRTWARGRAHE
eukprot:6202377-Pleurochrysis_carterae.AAC.7